jgi:hypothetical protein
MLLVPVQVLAELDAGGLEGADGRCPRRAFAAHTPRML